MTDMQLLDFKLPPYARIQWATKEIKEEWEPKLQKAAHVYNLLEVETVKHGIRRATTAHIPNDQLPYFQQNLAKQGLTYFPIRKVGSYSGFAHAHPPVEEGRPWNWYGAIAKDPYDAYLFAYYSSEVDESRDRPIDHKSIGKLLGYPECCMEFFNTVWMQGYVDPIWQEAVNCNPENIKKQTDTYIRIKDTVPWQTTVMLRYIGARLVPHIPCSLDCKHTEIMAKKWHDLAVYLKLDGYEYLSQLLQMPMEWDCLKGQAYISTPLFKIETNSVTCYPKYVVAREGTYYPEGAPDGLKFPWNEHARIDRKNGK